MSASWQEFVYRELKEKSAAYRELMEVDDVENTPYASRYAGAEIQDKLLAAAETFANEDDLALEINGSCIDLHTLIGRLYTRKGEALMHTDLVHEAENSFRAGLDEILKEDLAKPRTCNDICAKMSALSNLGILYSNRTDYPRALAVLREAEATFHEVTKGTANLDDSQVLHDLEGCTMTAESEFSMLCTLSLFALAQVFQKTGDLDQAANYCLLTLGRQASLGLASEADKKSRTAFNYDNWIQNAAQLSCHFCNSHQYAAAHHMLNAASEVVKLAKEHGGIEAEVEANMDIAWGRYYLGRLNTSVKDDLPENLPTELPENLHFTGLDLPAADTLPWGNKALATTYDEMRVLFGLCTTSIRSALEYYKLDGMVTEHVHLLLDAALAYRDLAWFEKDPHRRCVMHKNRVKQFKVVDGTLNFQKFPGLTRSIMLECATAYRDILDIKMTNKWPEDKIYAAAQEAIKHYSRLLDTFREDGIDYPEKIDEEWEGPMLASCVAQARIHIRLPGTDSRALNRAQALLKYVGDYSKRNTVVDFEEQVAVFEEYEVLLGRLKLKLETEGVSTLEL